LYGQYGCDELLGQIGTRFIGRLECTSTAEYISNLVGDQKFIEKSWSNTSAKESSSTQSYSVQVRKAILPSTFMDILPCSIRNGLTGYCVTRAIGTFKTKIDGDWLFNQALKPKDESVPAFLPRPALHQILEPWTEDEARRFGIDIHFKISQKSATRKPKPSSQKSKRKAKSIRAEDPLKELFS